MNLVSEDTQYMQYLADNYFNVVKDKTVLEIASHCGCHTKLMLDLGAKNLICVEPNRNDVIMMADLYSDPRIKMHVSTANDYYRENQEQVDVVTCFGLLYHLHSPLHLVEQIINISNPKYFIVETLLCDNNTLDVCFEESNLPGNFFRDKSVSKPIRANIVLKLEDIYNCIVDTGYTLVKSSKHLGEFTHPSKLGIGLALFERAD